MAQRDPPQHDSHELSIVGVDVANTTETMRAVAELATRPFATSDEVIAAVLRVMARLLPSRTLFMARFDPPTVPERERMLRVVQAFDQAGCQVQPGDMRPLAQSFGRTMIATQTPLVIADVSAAPEFQQLPVTQRLGIGSYIGVPLVASAGYVVGALCGIDPEPISFATQPDQVEILQLLAQVIIAHTEREDTIALLRASEAERAAALVQAQASLATAEAHAGELEAIFEAMADGVVLYDTQGNVLQTNHAVNAMFGLDTRPGHIGLPMSLRVPAYTLSDSTGRPLAPEEWPMARVLRGEILQGPNTFDMGVSTLDGQYRLVSVSGAAVRDGNGKMRGAICIFRDVTARGELEQRTRAALQALMGMATALVGVPLEQLDADAELRDVQRVVELAQQVLAGHFTSIVRIDAALGDFVPVAVAGVTPDTEQRWWNTLAVARLDDYLPFPLIAELTAGSPVIIDIAHEPPTLNQDYFGAQIVLCLAAQIANGDLCILSVGTREPAGFSAEDIDLARAAVQLVALVIERGRLLQEQTASQARELALLQTNIQMHAFLGIAGHELRTPVTSMRANIQIAARSLAQAVKADLPPAVLAPLQRAQGLLEGTDRQILRLNRLIEDVLDITRIQTGKYDLRVERADVGLVVREAVDLQGPSWPGRAITLELPDTPILLKIDADRISQVVTNYLTNALKYSAEDAPVAVMVRADDQWVRVAVTDRGPGLAPEQQTQLWELFQQVDGITQQSGSGVGLGLGLYICRTIIALHQGQVGVESVVDQGSTFWFDLPLSSDQSDDNEPRSSHGG